ncbi:hypothetical protein [Sphingobium chungbukense]|uniref:hypothetical protein n=1 Tax=Sphingobium chungbukense TaxID=56193 RepID=UPI0012ED8724|nr:hypothetical protein [Sphingobium chungbukense]
MAFRVEIEPGRNRVRITLSGFATIDDVYQMERDFLSSLSRMPKNGAMYQLLYDVSEARIQSQEVVAELHDLCRRSPRVSACALVNASALAGRQLGRIFEGLGPTIFNDYGAAVEWLDSR